MEMTHPDILKMERDGYIGKEPEYTHIGVCENCGETLTDEFACFASKDGLFCSGECIDKYYEIHEVC